MSGIKNISMSKEKNNIYSGRRIHMKRYIPKIIVTILLGVACISIELAAFVCFFGVMVFIIWKANENL